MLQEVEGTGQVPNGQEPWETGQVPNQQEGGPSADLEVDGKGQAQFMSFW
ncbi:MAG: hypothetical protein RBU37_01105 [Myxococcota bacterium]|nr:hypothetical protein [Myxococcota bacterium]